MKKIKKKLNIKIEVREMEKTKLVLLVEQKLTQIGLNSIINKNEIDIVAEFLNIKDTFDETPKSKIIIFISKSTPQEINGLLALGVNGIIFKNTSMDNLNQIIKTVAQGGIWLEAQAVGLMRETQNSLPTKNLSRQEFRDKHSNLTQREYELLKLVVDGKSNNEIAQILTISEHTANAHVCNVIQKLVVDDRTQAAVKALKEGIV